MEGRCATAQPIDRTSTTRQAHAQPRGGRRSPTTPRCTTPTPRAPRGAARGRPRSLPCAQPSQELERTNALVLYYLHAWLNPCIFDAAFLDLPRVSALLVRRLRGATSLSEAMASGLRSVIAGFS